MARCSIGRTIGVPVFHERPVNVLPRGSHCRLPEASPSRSRATTTRTPLWVDDNVNARHLLHSRCLCKCGRYRSNLLDQMGGRDFRRKFDPLPRERNFRLLSGADPRWDKKHKKESSRKPEPTSFLPRCHWPQLVRISKLDSDDASQHTSGRQRVQLSVGFVADTCGALTGIP